MFEKKIHYTSVQGVDPEDECPPALKTTKTPRYIQWIGSTLLVASLVANAGLFFKGTRHSHTTTMPDGNHIRGFGMKSQYAGLQYDTPRPFIHGSKYSDIINITSTQHAWDSLNFDSGMIYLTPEHAKSVGLPGAQNFPWDPELKIYLLNSYHNLHCLQSIQRSMIDLFSNPGKPPTYDLGHIMHCLDSLRDDVVCHADDTPRYTTPSEEHVSGMGQMRMCRNWNKLEDWASKYSGCWRYLDKKHDYSTEIWRWIYCPKDSPWAERIGMWVKKHEKDRPEDTPDPN